MPEPFIKPETVRRNAVAFIVATVLLDGIGLGIIIPVMPDLLIELRGSSIADAARWGGYLVFAFAAMQFLFSPTIGNLSDRFGRRPVLLASLGMMAVDYLIMALAPTLFVLFVGRVLAGIASATHSTANAYIADVTPKDQRSAGFGMVGAAFGVGFILGPVIGGIAGEFGTRVPFYVAAAFAFANFLYGYFIVPESLPETRRRPFEARRANPLGALRQVLKLPMIAWLFVAFFLFQLANWVYPATWSYFTKEAFGWSAAMIGLSLAAVGLGFAITQGWMIRYILRVLGEPRTALFGFLTGVLGLVGLAFASASWMVFALMPVVAIAAITTPALTGLMANRVPDDAQGELQGAISSLMALTQIISPLVMTQLFGAFTAVDAPVYFPGAPYLFAAVLMALAILPFAVGLRQEPAPDAAG